MPRDEYPDKITMCFQVRLLEEEREEMRSKVAELEASNARVRHEVKDQVRGRCGKEVEGF